MNEIWKYRFMKMHVWLFVCFLVCSMTSAMDGQKYNLTIRMNNVTVEQADDHVCIGKKLDPAEAYIVRFMPHADRATVHHMTLIGCHVPAVDDYTHAWKCSNAVPECGDSDSQRLYSWALGAPAMSLPDDVGFRVGGSTGINYLVVNLHYAHRFKDGQTDSSGYTLHLTTQKPALQAGYFLVKTSGTIPPQLPEYHMEASCKYKRNFTIHPFAYRTHSHNLGVVTSGYRIRDGQWTEIGRMSPQLPQAFYPVSSPGLDIQAGDFLAARCTMNSMARTVATPIGGTNWNEMCNFIIMYSTAYQGKLVKETCAQDANKFHWSSVFPPSSIPDDASSLADIAHADIVRAKFHMKPRS